MSEPQLTPLQAIMVEEEDLDLFPDRVLDLHEQGLGLQTYSALRVHAKKVREPKRRQTLGRYLSMLRLWGDPVESPPNLFTFNGIGTRLYGAAQPGELDTRISTVWFTLLYLPVFPLGSYLVAPADEGS